MPDPLRRPSLVPPHAVLLCKVSGCILIRRRIDTNIVISKSPEVRQHDLSHVRSVMVGAAPLSAELHQQLVVLFPNAHLGQSYGKLWVLSVYYTQRIQSIKRLTL